MSLTVIDYSASPDVLAAAREFIRTQGGCVVSIRELMNELTDELGDWFGVEQALTLIEALWDDPHVDQVHDAGLVEFAWSEEARY
jgi:hypothetical protein